MTKSWIIPFIVYRESFKGSRPIKGEAESKGKSFLLLGATSKRHLLKGGNKQQLDERSWEEAAFPPKLLWKIFRDEVTQTAKSKPDSSTYLNFTPRAHFCDAGQNRACLF